MLRTVVFLMAGLLLVGNVFTANQTASANSNTMTGVGRAKVNVPGAATAQTLKPAICAGITLTAVVSGSGTFTGTGAQELILGSGGVDAISGGGGADCMLGGGGDDALLGGGGADVCDGGPGADTFTNCTTTYN